MFTVDIPAELLTDDTELMPFGFRFLKQMLFGENSINIHEETAATRMGFAEKKLQQLEAGGSRETCDRWGWDV